MTKSTKIVIAIIACVLAVCAAITAGVSISSSRGEGAGETRQSASESAQQTTGEQQTTAAAPRLEDVIIGKWMDSAEMSGYEFFSDGKAKVTYVNLTVPVVNLPINGTAVGSYTVSGDTLTVSYSIYKRTIKDSFTASVENNTLTLVNKDDGETASYRKVDEGAAQESTYAGENGIVGGWINSDGNVRYTFNADGTAKVSYSNAVVPYVSASALNGSYSGVYMTDGSSLTVQFTIDGRKVTQKYDYAVSENSMSLTDADSDTTIFVREGSSFSSTDKSDLIGNWLDGSSMSGYNFKSDGTVSITYVNFTVPVINMPISGSYDGVYTVNGNRVTVSATIYSRSVVNTYTFEVTGNTLTLKNVDSGEISTYLRKQ